MKKRWIVALAVVVSVLFVLRPRQRPTADTPASVSTPGSTSVPASITPAVPPAAPAAGVPATLPGPPSPENLAGDPSAPPSPDPATSPVSPEQVPLEQIRDDIDKVQFALRDYRTVLGENPIGTNAEITKALTGNNLKQVKIPVPPGSSINGEGEMCDRWGTPYFFHQISGKQMEIHSAGPDRKMGTKDDLVVK